MPELEGEMKRLKKRDILSNDLKVILKIYECEKVEEQPIYLSQLVEKLRGEVSRATISKSIDKLFDLGMINARWEKEGSRWVRQFYISGESEEFVKELYERMK